MNSALTGIRKSPLLFAMLLPGMIFIFVFNYIPMLGSYIAFAENYTIFDNITTVQWAGFSNFTAFLTDPYFWQVMKNTLIISFGKLLIGFPLGIIFAVMLNELRLAKFKKISQTISYIPYFFSWVIFGGMIIAWLSTDGLVNNLLMAFGFIEEPIAFLLNPDYYHAIAIITDVWKNLGWSTIIYLAAMTSIDPSLYEAAEIDGATRMQRIMNITLPGIKKIIALMLVLAVGGLLASNLDQTLVLQNSINQPASEVIDSYIMKIGLEQGDYAYATAIGLFRSVISISLVGFAAFMTKKVIGESVF